MAGDLLQVLRFMMAGIILLDHVQDSGGNQRSSRQNFRGAPLSFIGWQDYWKHWTDHNYQMSQRMYPFNLEYGDKSEEKTFSLTLTESVPFYAVNYKKLVVSLHGHVAFSNVSQNPDTGGERVEWPNQEYPGTPDPPFIAPLYAAHSTEGKGKIYYREMIRSLASDPRSRINLGQLEQISSHVQRAMVGADSFQASRGLMVTWADMSFQGVYSGSENKPRNTYQMALVTDNTDSYVVLNYYKMTWVGTPSTGCSPVTGKAWDELACTAAQIGFNVGEGRYFWHHPYSMSYKISDLDQDDYKGSTVRGRFFYRVSDAFILRGGCTNDVSIAGPRWPLAMDPPAGGMFGGFDVNISAPCFSTNLIQCKFGEEVTEGVYDQDNIMKASCPAPMLNTIGTIKLAVSTDGGKSFPFSNEFTVGIMGYVPAGITIDNPLDDWLNVERLDLTWNPRALTWKTTEAIDVHLYGYKETGSGESYTGSWRQLHAIAVNIQNIGLFSVAVPDVQCGGDDAEYICHEYNVGAFQVRKSNTNPGASPTALWSSPIPLGWFVKTELTRTLGTQWAHRKCLDWHDADVKDEYWQREVPVCPCTLGQALADWGRFPVDIHCNSANSGNSDNCRRHKLIQHCVRSTLYTAEAGAGSQCCYDSRGQLVYSGDSQYGSTLDRAHPWGSAPYGLGPRVPTLSHWHWDIAPFYMCCDWQSTEYDCFQYYISRRLTKDCRTYRSPGHAAVFGDPHIRTFDGATYTFNGHGEFWLVRAVSTQEGRDLSFGLQVRFQQLDPSNGRMINATVLTSVAMQEKGPGGVERRKVELQRNIHDPGDRKILVFVEGELIDFKNPDLWRQDYPDVIIMNNDPPTKKTHSNFTVIYRSSGVGVQVAYKSDILQLITVMPPEFYEHTEGLFGNWDGSAADDIKQRGGGQGIPADDTKRIHPVGNTWQITASESFFKYWAQVNRDYYWKENFLPVFEPAISDSDGPTLSEVEGLCGSDPPCRYDYMVTYNSQIAKETLDLQAWVNELTASAKEVITCGWLNVPNAIKKQPINYSPGSIVIIESCRHGFELNGPNRYECVAKGYGAEWQPKVTTVCKDLTEAKEAEVQMAIAIGVPVGIFFVIIVIGVVGLICYLRQKRIDKGPKAEKAMDDLEHIPASTFHASSITPEDEQDSKSKKKKPRPAKPGSVYIIPLSRSNDDLAMRGNNYPSIYAKKQFSASADDLERAHDSSDGEAVQEKLLNDSSSQAGSSTYKRPYEYPRNTESTGKRRRAPYNYPRGTDNLTDEERKVIELRARNYEDT